MIERLDSIRGAWNEDTVRLIKKVNEIVDTLNGESGKKVAQDPRETKEREKGKTDTKVKTPHKTADKDKVGAETGPEMTMGTLTRKKERTTSTRGY
jgi:hypothetical protein